jgi:hypothetical protein
MTLRSWSIALSFAALSAACSSDPDPGGGIGKVEPSAGGAFSGAGGGPGFVDPPKGGGSGLGGGAACVSSSNKAEPMPVDMFFMFDQSSSMGDPITGSAMRWWDAAVQAVNTFVDDPRASGLGVGIQYFPLAGEEPEVCNAPYSTAEVELLELPAVAPAIKASIAAHQPQNFTPSRPALQGAVDYMKAHVRPNRAPAVVFVTDGFPTQCDPKDITDVAAVAKAAFEGTPSIRTFVIGFNVGLENLNQIAKAGGTGKAFLIEGGNVGEQFVTAMLSISSKTLQCNFKIPDPPDDMVLDPAKFGVSYTPSATGVAQEIPKLNTLGDCEINNGQGWYYDNLLKPTELYFCPGTCSQFAAGVLTFNFGCEPLVGPTK